MKNHSYPSALYPFKSRKITLSQSAVHYIDEGSGPVLLFSHPAVASSFMYRDFIKILRQQYRCIALDYPGFGLSGQPGNYSFDIVSQSNILEQFIGQLGLRDITVLGHDTGGPSAFLLAARRPEWFHGFILTDTIIFPTREYPRIDTMLGIVGSSFFQWLNAATNLLIHLTYRLGIPTRRPSAAVRREYLAMFNTPARRRRMTAVLHSLKTQAAAMQQIRSAFEHQLNNKPALLIYGEKDPVTELGIPQRIAAMLPKAQLHFIAGEGHFPHEAAAEEMAGLIGHWMEQLVVDGQVLA